MMWRTRKVGTWCTRGYPLPWRNTSTAWRRTALKCAARRPYCTAPQRSPSPVKRSWPDWPNAR
eukprot:9486063-Pyramimonas_sp.AAC.1